VFSLCYNNAMMKKGFSLLEIIFVIAIAGIVFAISSPYVLDFYRRQLLDEARSNIISALEQAKHNSILQKDDDSFGVSLTLLNGYYVIFQGDATSTKATSTREESEDIEYPVISGITFSGLTDVVFSKLTGLPSATGTITLDYGGISKGILVDSSGTISKVD